MPRPRYSPRTYTTEPQGFGKSTTLVWKELGDQEPLEQRARLLAAKIQHAWAVKVNSALRANRKAKRRPRTQAEYAQITGASVDRVGRVLRGEVVVKIEETAIAMIVLNVD